MSLVRTVLISLSLLLVLIPGAASADGDGSALKYIDGPHMIVVNPNAPHPHAGATVTYNLRLYEVEKGLPITFERVRVAINQGTSSLFGKSLTVSPYNDADFSFTYPKAANYTLVLQFFDQGKTIARGEFPVLVEEGAKKQVLADWFTIRTGLAFLLGAGVTMLYVKRGLLSKAVPKRK